MAAASTIDEFVDLLGHLDGVLVEVVHFPSGDVRGYKVAVADDPQGPIWYSGSKLAPDLSPPQDPRMLSASMGPQPIGQGHVGRVAGPTPGAPRATAAAERGPHHF
ncbi:hypothetical protein ACRAWF_44950 [Streptomyces sp. L7]